MKFGIHLPQYGRAAGAESIVRAAQQAETLGFADVWVSDHLAVPTNAPYPPAFLFEPLVSLTWAAAATSTIRLGTGVLILPYRHPLHLANEVAALDIFSGHRVLLGIGAGWLEEEFSALGVPFADRGARTDDALAALRACWELRPVDYAGTHYKLRDLQVLPQPARVPVWSGGSSARAIRRAVKSCDGWQGSGQPPEEIAVIIGQLREQRPGLDFTISVRVDWDGLKSDRDAVRSAIEDYIDAGVDHIYACPSQSTIDGWLSSVEKLHEIFEPYRA
jgi:probable F420-dependent oxidoreductase